MSLRGFDLLKKQGIMVYSTCTYSPVENESVVDFLLKHRHAELVPLTASPASSLGFPSGERRGLMEECHGAGRFYPHRIDSVGFFMAKIRRPG